jgi:hypothetical protein
MVVWVMREAAAAQPLPSGVVVGPLILQVLWSLYTTVTPSV